MRLLLVLLALALAACDGAAISEDAFAEIALTPGISNVEIEGADGETVRLTLSVPEALRADERLPLVIALHWSGEVTPFYGETYLRALAAPGFSEMRAIIVAPDRLGDDWERPASQRLIRSIVTRATDLWPVDPGRVVVTGYSMGGFGTWITLDTHPGLFRAGIAMAAYPITDGGGRPVYVLHGTRDGLYAMQDTERACERLRADGHPVTFQAVEGLTHTEPAAYAPALREAVRWLETDVW